MTTSTHCVEIVPVVLQPHPNADTLSIVTVFGYTVVVRTADWAGHSLGAYIPPDSVVDAARPEFAFLQGKERIRVRKFRGIMSQGLLVAAPPGAQLGENVADALGVTHYDPPPPKNVSAGGEEEAGPSGRFAPSYDLETWYRYKDVLQPGEPVVVTEKLHGACSRFCWQDGRFWCGSKNMWKREDARILWWKALEATPRLREFLVAHPEITVYAEVYGRVQDLHYGSAADEVRVAVFDLLRDRTWLSHEEARALGPDLPWVPVLWEGAYNEAQIRTLADGPSTVPGAEHVREGIVITPRTNRFDPQIGRVKLKMVSNAYLERG